MPRNQIVESRGELLPEVEKLRVKYDLAPNTYYEDGPVLSNFAQSDVKFCKNLDWDLSRKWADYTEPVQGSYNGFGMSYPTPIIWWSVIDDWLESLAARDIWFSIVSIHVEIVKAKIFLNVEKENLQQVVLEITQLERLLSEKKLAGETFKSKDNWIDSIFKFDCDK